MANEKTFTEETAAPGTGAGFDYQFYYFLYRLLNMKKGQSIGLEIKDDIHSDQKNDVQLLFQVKHTIQKQAGGKPIALSELDHDLWKTLHNWARVISDPRDKRIKLKDQLEFIKRTEFHLVSNKSVSNSNEFSKRIIAYSEHPSPQNFILLTNRLKELKNSCSDKKITTYITVVMRLDKPALQQFFKKIYFQLEEVDIINKIKDTLEEKWIPPEEIDNTYGRLCSLIRDDNYISILAGKLKPISFTDFRDRYRKVISSAVKKPLSKLTYDVPLAADLLNQRFIKQLIAIEDISSTDQDEITKYSTHKIRLARSLEAWVQKGEVVSDEVNDFHKDVTLRWDNKHRRAFRKCEEHELNEKAQNIIGDMREEKFRLGEDELNTEHSNGELYLLSDENTIGWHRDWKIL
ncbi:ABC-three component system protein [Pseudomonas syringae]|uniref:ABC-three component systems C-terminal domain-containing protein n=1 Tax=Pseudomonas syringae pv. syringae (strain B728a) TaxID=205918 RepID=Q4ZPT4_PSEU2|nr:ABC-three component system protein [Pseudomonas syringae]AAY38838.1 hypothetical protein Psyr_3807 [Pseudomonas syringae pv. syringae B728a]PYD15337.1 hypothetical protein DND47_12935 [Pseudomonas syringae pv. syringae]